MLDPEDVSKLCVTTWPKLVMVVCDPRAVLKSYLSAQWIFMMEVVLFLTVSLPVCAILIRSRQKLHTPLLDLTSQHYRALSGGVGIYDNTGTLHTMARQ